MRIPDDWETPTVEADGATLQCYRTGSGPPVVLAHGLYDTGRRWVPTANALADRYEIVTYDARGHGRSDAPDTGYTIADRVADLRAVADGLDLSNPVLVGHSMGGGTVAWTAATHPAFPAGVVVVDPEAMHDLPDVPGEELAAMVRQQIAEAAEQSIDELVATQELDEDPEQARRLAAGSLECDPAISAIPREGYPSPLAERFPEITCPTLVVRRDADTDQRVQDLTAADRLPNGRLVHVPDTGHYVIREAFDTALTELRVFLRRHHG